MSAIKFHKNSPKARLRMNRVCDDFCPDLYKVIIRIQPTPCNIVLKDSMKINMIRKAIIFECTLDERKFQMFFCMSISHFLRFIRSEYLPTFFMFSCELILHTWLIGVLVVSLVLYSHKGKRNFRSTTSAETVCKQRLA